MLGISSRANRIIQWTTKFVMFSCLLSTMTLLAGVIEDKARLENISDLRSCFDTFRNITQENVQIADKNNAEKAQLAVDHVLSSLDFWESNPRGWQSVAWDLYPKFTRAYALLHGLELKLNEQFVQDGFRQGAINKGLNLNFLNAFQFAKAIPFIREDSDPNYLAADLGRGIGTEEYLNRCHTYVMLDDSQLNALKPILLELKEPIAECIGTPWRVVNVRAWKTPPKSEEFGPSNWHTDGMPSAVLKIMFYPLGASSEKGTVALQLPHGIHTIEEGTGAWVLFKNSEIIHKEVSPQIGECIAIEITILPSLTYDLTPICAGQNALHPVTPWQKPYASKHPLHKNGEVIGVNIGGGPNWSCNGWVNLEEVPSASNLYPFLLLPNSRFPIGNKSVKMVYTSHTMEHLIIPTAYRVLCEAHRILEEGGDLIIKIPDFDKALDCWRRQDPSFFGPGWNIESVTPSWRSKGLYDCLDYRAAMIFCSFFNDAFGNPFDPASNSDPVRAYFGPAVVDIAFLRNLIKDRSPSQITKELRKAIGSKENNFRFCHQSAWGREELKALLNDFGFEVVSFDSNIIPGTFGNIPGIYEMRDLSIFCWAKKKTPVVSRISGM